MSITRTRLTRAESPIYPAHEFKMVFFEDDLSPPICHVRTVEIDQMQLHHMRTVDALANALINRFQHLAQDVPGDREAIRDAIVTQVKVTLHV